jgi:hypothetical protein
VAEDLRRRLDRLRRRHQRPGRQPRSRWHCERPQAPGPQQRAGTWSPGGK